MLQQEIKNQTNNSKYPTNTTYMYVQYKYWLMIFNPFIIICYNNKINGFQWYGNKGLNKQCS